MVEDAKLQVQLEMSMQRIGQKALIKDMIEIIQTPEFPRNTSKKFLVDWLNRLNEKL